MPRSEAEGCVQSLPKSLGETCRLRRQKSVDAASGAAFKRYSTTTMPSHTQQEVTVVERGIILILFHLQYTIAMISRISSHP